MNTRKALGIILGIILTLICQVAPIWAQEEVPPAEAPPEVLEPVAPVLEPAPAFIAPPGADPGGFDAQRFLGQGDRFNCPDFASQAQAQAVLRADPSDPNALDTDRDGLACETRPQPRDPVRVPR
jgi:hypothetical protein